MRCKLGLYVLLVVYLYFFSVSFVYYCLLGENYFSWWFYVCCMVIVRIIGSKIFEIFVEFLIYNFFLIEYKLKRVEVIICFKGF